MGWSTSVIAPPDGDMAAYMASLDKLLGRPDLVYWPTHGPAITEPQDYVRAFIAHRREREAGILDCLRGRCRADRRHRRTTLYRPEPGVAPCRRALGPAHLIDLVGRGIVDSDGPATLDAHYRIARN